MNRRTLTHFLILPFIFSFFCTLSIFSQTPHDYGWQVGYGYSVGATALKGDTMFVGGDFDCIGYYSGSMASVDLTTAAVQKSFPVVNGTVRTMIPDGSGGYYIGGSFSLVDGYKRIGLAHILSNKKLDLTWDNSTDEGTGVYALLLSPAKDILWVGGTFTSIGGLNRDKVAAINLTTGVVMNGFNGGAINKNWWAPAAVVCALAYYPGDVTNPAKLFIGGDFASINWNTRSNMASLNPTNGSLLTWRADMTPCNSTVGFTPVSPVVRSLVVAGSTNLNGNVPALFIGGLFTSLADGTGNHSCHSITATDVRGDGGFYSNFSAKIFPNNDSGLVNSVKLLKKDNGQLILGIGGKFRDTRNDVFKKGVQNFGLIDFLGFNTNYSTITGATVNGRVVDTTFLPGVYASGEIFAFDTITGGGVVLGGNFEGIQSTGVTVQVRRNLALLDMNSNTIKSWAPAMQTDLPVRALNLAGGELHVAGSFTTADVAYRRNLAAVSLSTKTVFPFNPKPDSYVNDFEFSPTKDTLYFAGNFHNVGTSQRGYTAAYNLKLDFLMPWASQNGAAGGGVEDIVLDPVRKILYAGGKFTLIQNKARNHLAAININDGSVINTWTANVKTINGQITPVRALALTGNGDTLFVGGRYDEIAGQPRANLAAISNKITLNAADATATLIAGWNFPVTQAQADIGVLSLLNELGRLFVGGKYESIGGNTGLRNISAINISTSPNALITNWAPVIDAGGRGVWCMKRSDGVLYLGGDFGTTNGYTTSFASAVYISTGDIVGAWKPFPTIQPIGGVILTLAVDDKFTYLGGSHENMTENINDAVFHLATIPGVNITLPQTIQSFSAQRYNDDCLIQWSVFEEDAMISLQRSINGTVFNPISNFTAAGSNRYLDTDVQKGFTYYYRLKIISASGQITYSSVRKIAISSGNNNQVQAFVINSNTLRVIHTGESSFIRIFSAGGQCITAKDLKKGINDIPLDRVSKGIYFYQTGKGGNGASGKIYIQ